MGWILFSMAVIAVCILLIKFLKIDMQLKIAIVFVIVFVSAFTMLGCYYDSLYAAYEKRFIKPTIDDVPEKAHVTDTIVTVINGNDTTYTLNIEWNNNKN